MKFRMTDLTRSLGSNEPEELRDAIAAVAFLSNLSSSEKHVLAESLASVFSRLQAPLSISVCRLAISAQDRLAGIGVEIAPFLAEKIATVDIESAAHLGKALAKIGKPGLDQLLLLCEHYTGNTDAYINLIQALAFTRMPEASDALPLIHKATNDKSHSVRAKALSALAHLIGKSSGMAIGREVVDVCVKDAFDQMSDNHALVRKNAVAVLGQLIRKKLLSSADEKRVHALFVDLLGKGEKDTWDSAFVVRQEVERFLRYCLCSVPLQQRYIQSFRILQKRFLCNDTFHFTIEAPYIARKIEPGQFIIVRPHVLSERIPLSVCGWDRSMGTIDIIVSAVGKTSTEINQLAEGASFKDIVGPLGERSHIPTLKGTCVVIGGGYGAGAIIPTAADLKKHGQRVIGIVGARHKASLIMVNELIEVCDELIVTTNDGSRGREGLVTDALADILAVENVVHVLAIGPVPMMKAVGELTRPMKIQTFASLNAIMVDGTGMCGACRVSVGNKTKFACIHGPDFDAHQVDFENLMKRQKMFVKEERLAFERMKAHPKETTCELG